MERAVRAQIRLVAVEAAGIARVQHGQHPGQRAPLGLEARDDAPGPDGVQKLERAVSPVEAPARSTLTMSSAISGTRSAA